MLAAGRLLLLSCCTTKGSSHFLFVPRYLRKGMRVVYSVSNKTLPAVCLCPWARVLPTSLPQLRAIIHASLSWDRVNGLRSVVIMLCRSVLAPR